MVGLLDIAEQKKTVPIRGKDVDVVGVCAQDVVYLFGKFPELRAVMSGRKDSLAPEAIAQMAPGAVAAVIAAGTGACGDRKAEAIAAKLAIGEQLELMVAIFELTFPHGVGPFVTRLERLGLFGKLPVAATGWEADTKSPEQSKNSSPSAMASATFGA